MSKIYCFDCDETLEISNGPVTIQMMKDLRDQGHIVAMNGNWALFCQKVPDWHKIVSMMNVGVHKVVYLTHIRAFIPADDYVMVGNIGFTFDAKRFNLTPTGGSDDMGVAADAQPPWRFILERDFAAGAR